MESRERLTLPSPAPPSLHKTSSSSSSSPAPTHTLPTQYSPTPGSEGSTPLAICGRPLRVKGDEHSNKSVNPAFGLYTASSSYRGFGGLGSLGLSSLAAHSQLGAFPDWWRPSNGNTPGAAAFFPPLLGLHPVFLSTFKSLNPLDLQSRISVSVNGAINGGSTSSPPVNSAVSINSFPAKERKKRAQTDRGNNLKSIQESVKQQNFQKTKKPTKRPPETTSTSGCLLGSESSSDGEECSSDPDDMEEDKDDQSSDSEDSDSEEESPVIKEAKRLTHSALESKKRRPCAADGNISQQNHCRSVPVTSTYRPQSYSHPTGPPKSTAPFPSSTGTAEEEGQQHISVIQTTGLALSNGSLTCSHREACPLPKKSSSNSISLPSSSKHLLKSTSSKQSFASSSQKPLALCSIKKTRSLCSSPKHPPLGSSSDFSLPSVPKPRTLLACKEALLNPKSLIPPEKLVPSVSSIKKSSGNLPGERSSHLNSLKQPIHLKDSVKQASSVRPQNQICSDTKLLSNFQPNGVQDAPLALITKPRSQSSTPSTRPVLAATRPSYLMPVNLSTGTRETCHSSASSFKSALSGLSVRSKKATRSCESDFHSSNDSDDSFGDNYDDYDEEDGMEDEESGSSLSDSESHLESDSDGSEADIKECVEKEADGDADGIPLKSAEALLSSHKSSFNRSASCSVLNLQISRPPGVLRGGLPNLTTDTKASNYHANPSPSFTFGAITGSGRRRRVTDERVLQVPLEFGWRRETQVRTVAGRLQGEVAYFAPCGKKLRQYPDVMKYLVRNGITEISRDNFSFSTKMKVGDFYEAREGQEGLQWCLLAKDEIVTCIIAMDGRRSRRPKSEHQLAGDGSGDRHPHPVNLGENNFQDVSDSKLLRKLEAQEIARQAAQIKMMRKLEKQAMAQAAKEARKQQAIMAAEERRKKREELKILKQQEKIKRIQQIRMEKELRAQQILEAKRKKKEAAANAKILEAEKRNKEKEMRRLQAVILKHQELERHRVDMERERRRQHMILMKAVEARKKAEEKQRVRQEKKDEKRLNKQRKLEIRRLELEKAKELKKPNEDMFLADHKPLPDLSRIPGLVLPGSTVSDCLMVLQFLRSFGKVLRLDSHAKMLSIIKLQEGLLNVGESMYKVQDLLVSMLSAALCDPGIPAGNKSKTILGDHLINVDINRDNVSEILQMYMEGVSDQTEVAALAVSLKTKAFQAHSPSQKASMLAFLVNELCCSKAVISEIDKNIDCMTNLRKDKWVVEGKLRQLRSIHAKTTGKRDGCVGGEDSHTFDPPTVRNKGKRKDGDSEDEEEEDDDSEEQGDDEEEEEEEESGGKKGKKAEMCDEEDDAATSASIEELEKQIEKTCKLQSQIRKKLFDSSHSLRSMMIGEDRYKRRYWVLPQCGGILVEGMESGEGYEDVVEGERQKAAQMIRIKKEKQEEARKPVVSVPVQSTDGDKRTPVWQQDNLFLQKPSSLSKLSKLLEVAKMAQYSDISAQKIHTGEVPATAFYHSYPTSQTDKADASVSSLLGVAQLRHGLWMTHNPKSILHYDQLSKILTENSSEWFSLLPRSPCDGSSVTSGSSPSASSSSPQPIRTKSPSFFFPNPSATESCNTTAGINSSQSHIPKQVKPGIHQSRLTLSDVFSSGTSPSLPISGTSLPSQHAEGNGNKVLCLADTNFVNKSETPEPQRDKPSCASFPVVESAKTQDYPCPQPIPEEMLHGWWRVSDIENLHSLVKTLHSRGIREKALQKQIQKHLEHAAHLCASSKDEFDGTDLEKQELSRETLETWCIEQQAMKVDISLLQQVEALERRVISASLQVKGWMPPEPQSDSKNLVYHEHKFSSLSTENKAQKETSLEEFHGCVVRRPNNPLEIAVSRLLELERNIERSSEEDVAPGMRLWHKALSQVRSSAQLSLCIQQLQKSIAWDRAIMRVHCQLCQRGDNEELLLLCDGCDRGCHTYCHNPKITTVPDGDWFCPFCVAKESDQTPRSRKQQSRTAGGEKKCAVKRDSKPSAVGELIAEEDACSNSMLKRPTKEFKKRKGDYCSQARDDSPVSSAKKAKTSKDSNSGLAVCRVLLAELEAHQDAWPFLTPVNHKAVPGYRKVVKKPMDFSTIKEKLTNNLYLNLETFIIDVNLVFDNCEKFNEDDSEIGRAGHNMRRFFDKRWTELLQ